MSDRDFDKREKEPWEYENKNLGTRQGSEPENGGKPEQPAPADGSQAGEGHAPAAGAADGAPGESAQPQPPRPDGGAQNPVPPYRNPQYQNPPYGGYSPYGQYGGYYGSGQPYGYGQQPQHEQGQPKPGAYDNPYLPPQGRQGAWSPYGGGPGQNPPPHKMSGGLKAFLWILGVVVVGVLVSYIIYTPFSRGISAGSASSSASSSGSLQSSPGQKEPSSSGTPIIGGVKGDGTDPNAAGISVKSKPTGAQMSASVVYKSVIRSVVGVETTISSSKTTNGESETGEGTGIVATNDGYILTNAHVVDYSRSNNVKVVLYNNKVYEAKVVGFDKTTDLAVLKINASGLSPAVLGDTGGMEIGDQVIAIGNPGGLSYAGSLTGGYISALNRSIENHSDSGMTYIQTDAAINPGNSGGPLVNMYAQVVGINSNKIVATGYEGMGFAIPVSRAQTIINALIRHGYVSGRCRLGITGMTVDDMHSQLLGYPQGVQIKSIDSDSDMKRAGASVGDVITEADGKTVTSLDDLYAALDGHKPGDEVAMKIYTGSAAGNGGNKTIRVKLLEDKGETQK